MSHFSALFKFTNKGGAMIAALLLIYLMKPYFFWHNFLGSIQVTFILTILLGAIFLKNRDKDTSGVTLMTLFFIAITVMYVVINRYNIMFSMTFFPLVFLPFAYSWFWKDVYNNFLNLYSVIVAISLVVWVMVLIGVMPTLGTIEPLNTLKSYNYQVYPLLVRSQDSFRFFGPFDEPGVIGTISGIILCIQKFNLEDRRNVIILASGLCSLSFFFFLLIAIYFLLYFIVEKRSFKSAFIYIVCILVVKEIITNVPVLYEILGTRFEWDAQSGMFVGDDRSNEYMRDYFVEIMGTHEFWWGVEDKESYLELVAGTSSYINSVLVNGMAFMMIYVLFFCLYAWRNKYSIGTFCLFVFVFLATLYQRPYLYHAEYIFLWIILAKQDNSLNYQNSYSYE